MTRWKKDERTFTVKLLRSRNKDDSETRVCTIPKPLADRFGQCDSLRFDVTDDGTVTVQQA